MERKDLLNWFIGAHIIKDVKNEFQILYDGKIDNIGNVIDSSKAEDRYYYTHKQLEYKDISIKFLGDVVKINIPIFSKTKKGESIKSEYLKVLNVYIKQ